MTWESVEAVTRGSSQLGGATVVPGTPHELNYSENRDWAGA